MRRYYLGLFNPSQRTKVGLSPSGAGGSLPFKLGIKHGSYIDILVLHGGDMFAERGQRGEPREADAPDES